MRGRAVRSERYWRWTRRSARAVLTAEQRQNLFPPQSGARGVLLHQLVRALIPFIARIVGAEHRRRLLRRSEEHTSELQSLMRISYAVFCLKKKNKPTNITHHIH